MNTKEEIIEEVVSISPYLSDQRDDFNNFCKFFSENFPRWAEISITPHDKSVGLMTRGVGDEFVQKVKEFLLSEGMDAGAVDIFDKVEKYFPDINMLVKRDFYEKQKFKFNLYWQFLVSARILSRMAPRFGVTAENVYFFREASLLLRSHTVYLGLSFKPPSQVFFRVFFSNPLRKSVSFLAPALSALITRVGLDAETVNYFIGFHNYLSQVATGKVFTSIGFGEGPPSAVKVDYEIIPPNYARLMMEALDVEKEQQNRLLEVMKFLQMKRITYVGVKYVPDSLPRLKFYFDRRFSKKNEQNPQVLADFLQETIWTP